MNGGVISCVIAQNLSVTMNVISFSVFCNASPKDAEWYSHTYTSHTYCVIKHTSATKHEFSAKFSRWGHINHSN